ncbi:MAG: hypothetical protein JO170_17105 [Verrucomicrobia bacterium]|nr:hypothetical protein [Verrucomicrobiota bacterium]
MRVSSDFWCARNSTRPTREQSKHSGVAELIIAKQRTGPTGEVPLTFLKQFTRFESRPETNEPGEKVVSMLRARPRVFT